MMLSDVVWREICTAALPFTPGPEARAQVTACLFEEYPNLAYDRERVARALRVWGPVLRRLGTLIETYRQMPAVSEDIVQERDLFYLEHLHRRALSQVLGLQALRRANRGQQNPQQAWLITRLCSIWSFDFGGELGFAVPSLGGPPAGPLISFLRVAMRQVVPEPSPHTLRRAIEREHDAREAAKQWGYFLARNPMAD
jgi:hypothetical protein